MNNSQVEYLKKTQRYIAAASYHLQLHNFELAMTDPGDFEERYFYHSIEYAGCYFDFTSHAECKKFYKDNNLVWPMYRMCVYEPPETGAVSYFIE